MSGILMTLCSPDRNSYGDEGRESLIRDEVFLDSPRLPSSATVGVGERLEMTCYIPGYPIPQVFWLKDGQQLNDHGSTNDFQIRKRGHVYQLIIPYALPHHAGLWEVIARNSAGLVMSGSRIEVRATERRSPPVPRDRRARSLSPCALTETSQRRANLCLDRPHMHEQAPQFTRLFRDQTASCGDDVRFECTVIGLPMPDIRWEHNGEELQQSTVRSFKISNIDTVHKLVLKTVDSTFSGRYTLIAENPMGVAACSAMLTVRRPISKGTGVVKEEPCLTEVHTPRGSPFTIHVSPREASPVFGDKVSTLDELSSKKIVNTKAQTPSSPGSILHPSTNT